MKHVRWSVVSIASFSHLCVALLMQKKVLNLVNIAYAYSVNKPEICDFDCI